MMMACRRASSSSGRDAVDIPFTGRLTSLCLLLELNLWVLNTPSRESTTPELIHHSFFCSWPIISFFRLRKAWTWLWADDGCNNSARMGEVESLAITGKATACAVVLTAVC